MFGKLKTSCKDHEKVEYLTENAQSFHLCMALVRAFIALLTITLNGIFLATILKEKRLTRRIPYKLMIMLSSIDFLQGLTSWPISIYLHINWYQGSEDCVWAKILNSVAYGLAFATVTVIFVIALDQYLAVVHPYFYIGNITASRLISPIILWNLLLYAVNLTGRFKFLKVWKYYKLLVHIQLLVVVIVNLYFYLQTMRHARVAIQRIKTTNKSEGKKLQGRARAARSTLIVLCATIVCYTPMIVFGICEKVGYITRNDTFSKTYIRLPLEMLVMVSSVTDPVVYYFRIEHLRIATRNFLLCRKHGDIQSGNMELRNNQQVQTLRSNNIN